MHSITVPVFQQNLESWITEGHAAAPAQMCAGARAHSSMGKLCTDVCVEPTPP
jgi:hypothetical protein